MTDIMAQTIEEDGERDHPLRAALSEEMHLRNLPAFSAPTRLVQIVTLDGEKGTTASRAHVEALCGEHGIALPAACRHFRCRLGALDFVWECHTEFSTYTFIRAGAGDTTFGPEDFPGLPTAWLDALPGAVIRATQIALVAADVAPVELDALKSRFADADLVVCRVADGHATIWSDFRLQADSFGRLLVRDDGLVGHEVAHLIQRLLELGNYRKMALLGLPLARRLTPDVGQLEQRLMALTGAILARASNDDHLLDELGYISAELARLNAETHYRMSATRAYATLASERLANLRISDVRGYTNLADFTDRRLQPAIRTCQSFSQRLEDLSQRVARTSSLLRTRVDTELAKQNRDLLGSMNRRAHMQLRLQQTVEGLSVMAISYYSVGLVGYVFKAAHHLVPALDVEIATGMAVPAILAMAFFTMHSIRRRLHHHRPH